MLMSKAKYASLPSNIQQLFTNSKKVHITVRDKNTNLQSIMQEQILSQNVCQFMVENYGIKFPPQ